MDADTCDDCSVLGVPDTSNDGTDTDIDGLCDAGDPDDDNDGWADVDEVVIGTDALDDCTDQPGDNDAWPPDIDMSTGVNILDVLMFKPVLSGAYDARYNLNAMGGVNILDVLMLKPVLGTSCAGV